jgi:hypothetical protein
MPCVFPILGLKALSLAKMGGDEGEARRDAVAYTVGIILSCLVLGGIMLALRAARAAAALDGRLQANHDDSSLAAALVLAHRGHEAVLRSAVSLAANQMAMQSDSCDLAAIEARWQHKIALREERMARALAGWRGPLARLPFDDINADWEGAIARCYADLGLTLTPQALTAMRKLMAASATGQHRAHSQQLARFAESG